MVPMLQTLRHKKLIIKNIKNNLKSYYFFYELHIMCTTARYIKYFININPALE
jgi:hypothetical protein